MIVRISRFLGWLAVMFEYVMWIIGAVGTAALVSSVICAQIVSQARDALEAISLAIAELTAQAKQCLMNARQLAEQNADNPKCGHPAAAISTKLQDLIDLLDIMDGGVDSALQQVNGIDCRNPMTAPAASDLIKMLQGVAGRAEKELPGLARQVENLCKQLADLAKDPKCLVPTYPAPPGVMPTPSDWIRNTPKPNKEGASPISI